MCGLTRPEQPEAASTPISPDKSPPLTSLVATQPEEPSRLKETPPPSNLRKAGGNRHHHGASPLTPGECARRVAAELPDGVYELPKLQFSPAKGEYRVRFTLNGKRRERSFSTRLRGQAYAYAAASALLELIQERCPPTSVNGPKRRSITCSMSCSSASVDTAESLSTPQTPVDDVPSPELSSRPAHASDPSQRQQQQPYLRKRQRSLSYPPATVQQCVLRAFQELYKVLARLHAVEGAFRAGDIDALGLEAASAQQTKKKSGGPTPPPLVPPDYDPFARRKEPEEARPSDGYNRQISPLAPGELHVLRKLCTAACCRHDAYKMDDDDEDSTKSSSSVVTFDHCGPAWVVSIPQRNLVSGQLGLSDYAIPIFDLSADTVSETFCAGLLYGLEARRYTSLVTRYLSREGGWTLHKSHARWTGP